MKLKLQLLEGGTPTLVEARAGINVAIPGPMVTPLRLAPIQFNAQGAYNLVVEIEGQRDPVIINFTVQLNLAPQVGFGMPRH